MMLESTVAMEVIIAFFGYPVARITLFSPIIVYVIGVPNKITCIKAAGIRKRICAGTEKDQYIIEEDKRQYSEKRKNW